MLNIKNNLKIFVVTGLLIQNIKYERTNFFIYFIILAYIFYFTLFY